MILLRNTAAAENTYQQTMNPSTNKAPADSSLRAWLPRHGELPLTPAPLPEGEGVSTPRRTPDGTLHTVPRVRGVSLSLRERGRVRDVLTLRHDRIESRIDHG